MSYKKFAELVRNNATYEDLVALIFDNECLIHEDAILHLCCRYNHVDVCCLLIDYGACVNTFFGPLNVLMTAVTYGNTQMVKILIERGVNLDAINNFGLTALSISIMLCRYEITDILVKANGINFEPNGVMNKMLFYSHNGQHNNFTKISNKIYETNDMFLKQIVRGTNDNIQRFLNLNLTCSEKCVDDVTKELFEKDEFSSALDIMEHYK